MLYCNDRNKLKAYIPLVAVSNEHRSKGHAKSMMEEAIKTVRFNGFRTIGIHSNNPHAIRLYEKMGFNIISGKDRVYMELNV